LSPEEYLEAYCLLTLYGYTKDQAKDILKDIEEELKSK